MPQTNDPNLEGADNGQTFLLHKEGYSMKDYSLIEKIGEGSFGEVWKADRAGFQVALKILRASVNSEETQREIESLTKLKTLHHKYLVHTENFWSDGDRLYIEMELGECTLKERLASYQAIGKIGIPEDELLKYFTEIGRVLDYLHTHRPVYLHRDIKPANILLVQGCAKLADFGLLRQVSADSTSTKTDGGSIPYMAPESLGKEQRYSIQSDLFALAVTYVELRQGTRPFPGNHAGVICINIINEPPEISDIFDPKEKAVLLKALEKDRSKRFPSCGEFIFELNRAVPWIAAESVKALPTPAKPGGENKANGASTIAKQPRLLDQKTKPKITPTTMPSIDLPPENTTGASTVFNQDVGTVRSETNRQSPKAPGETTAKKPGPDHGKTFAGSPAPLEKKKPVYQAPLPPPPAPEPARPKFAGRIVFAAVLLAVLVGGISGIWYLAKQGAEEAVRERIDNKKYAEAMQKVAETSGFMLPARKALEKEIEELWWAQVNHALRNDNAALQKQMKDLKEFVTAFPAHNRAKSLRDEIEEKIAATGTWPGSKQFGELLTSAQEKIVAKNFVGARADLSEATQLIKADPPPNGALEPRKLKNKYGELREQFVKHVTGERLNRENAAAVLDKLKPFERLRNDKEMAWTEDDLFRFDAARSLALAHVNDIESAFKLFVDLQKKDMTARLGEHTALFLALIPDQADLRTHVLNLGAVDALPKELQVLNRLVVAHGMQKDQQLAAVGSLVGFLSDEKVSAIARTALWPALARLEEKTRIIPFEDLAALEGALPKSPDDQVKIANSQILGSVLERQIKKDNFKWFADADQRANCLIWVNHIEKPSPYVVALKVECLVESGSSAKEILPRFPLKADWYGSYVHALALEKNNQVPLAADTLVDALKAKRDVLNPQQRTKKAMGILRHAVRTLQQKTGKDSKEFADEKDAAKAITWLTLVFDLLEQPQDDQSVDDFVALAFAAVKAKDVPNLAKAEARLEKLGTVNGFYYLAKAYGVEGKSDAKVLLYYGKAIDVLPAGQDDLRKSAATDIIDITLRLAKANFDKGAWKEAIANSLVCQNFAFKLRKWELEKAAKLNGKGVENEVRARSSQAAAEKKVDDPRRVYEEAIQRALGGKAKSPTDRFHFPVVIAKLAFDSNGLSKEQMAAAVEEGKIALGWTEKIIGSQIDKLDQSWWEKLHCHGIVNLADVRFTLFTQLDDERLKRKEPAQPALIRAECKEIREQYKIAREMKKYTEQFRGELAFKIGLLYFTTCALADQDKDKKVGKAEAIEAQNEFKVALQTLQSVSRTDLEEGVMRFIERKLDDPAFKALLPQ